MSQNGEVSWINYSCSNISDKNSVLGYHEIALYMRLGTVLIFHLILLTKTQQKKACDKHFPNRTGGKMQENKCKSFRIKSRSCKCLQCLYQFSKLNWPFKGCVIWRWESQGSENSIKKNLNNDEGKCASVVSSVTNYDINIWLQKTNQVSTSDVKEFLLTLLLVMMLFKDV